MLKAVPSFLIADRARFDLTRMTRDLQDLQRQTASGMKADSLRGYDGDASRLVNVRAILTQTEARAASAERAVSRLEVQDIALNRVAQASGDLRDDLFRAMSLSNGQSLPQSLETAFAAISGALNETWENKALFSGEADVPRVAIPATVQGLNSSVSAASLFSESSRDFVQDFGEGVAAKVGVRASSFATDLYVAMGTVQQALAADPVGFGSPINPAARSAIESAITILDRGVASTRAAMGANGETLNRVQTYAERERARSDLLTRELGVVADANLAEVAMRLSALQTQYQAAASVFTQIRDLSLVNFLR
jgi:flagellin-like hook-associated protein FlgL